MVATLEQARSLVTLLENELLARASKTDRMIGYYRGEQPLKFASPEFRKYFATRYREFADNWVQVVADSPVERLNVTGIKPADDDRADRDLWRVWQVNDLDSDSQLGFLGARTSGRSFVLVWGDPSDPDVPEVTFEDARECIVAYEPGSRRKRRAALKRWQDGNAEFATLYLRDEVWKFARPLLRHSRSMNLAGVDEVLVDGQVVTDWRLVGGRLWHPSGWQPSVPCEVTVTYTHGLPDVPADLVDLVCRIAAATLVASRGSEDGTGIAAGDVRSERIGDYSVTYGDDGGITELELPDHLRHRLAARFGEGAGLVESR